MTSSWLWDSQCRIIWSHKILDIRSRCANFFFFKRISCSDDKVQELNLVLVSSLCFILLKLLILCIPSCNVNHMEALRLECCRVCVRERVCVCVFIVLSMSWHRKGEKRIEFIECIPWKQDVIYLTNPAMDGVVIVSSWKSMGFKGKVVDLLFVIELYTCIATCVLEE